MHFNTGGHGVLIDVKAWIVMGDVGAFFFVSGPKKHKNPRHPQAEFGKILAGNGLMVEETRAISKHFAGGFPGDFYHLLIVDQGNILVDDLDLAGAAMDFAIGCADFLAVIR